MATHSEAVASVINAIKDVADLIDASPAITNSEAAVQLAKAAEALGSTSALQDVTDEGVAQVAAVEAAGTAQIAAINSAFEDQMTEFMIAFG